MTPAPAPVARLAAVRHHHGGVLALIPAMMTAVGVVREKEMGSITNLYAMPVSGLEFLLGKQLPYVAIAFASYLSLLLLALPALPGADQGQPWRADRRRDALCDGDHRLWHAGVVFRQNPTGRVVRYRRADHAAGDSVLRPVHAGFVPVGQRQDDGAGFPLHLFPAHQSGRLHQGARFRRTVAHAALASSGLAYLLLNLLLLKTQEE